MSQLGPGPSEQVNFLRKVILTICLVLAVMLSIFASIYRLQKGVDAQNQSTRVMFSVVGRYVEDHDGVWPKSWEDLESLPEIGDWYEPINYELVKAHVVINFDASVEELSKQVPAEFHAIDAINPVFDFAKDPRLDQLIKILAKYQNAE